MNDESEIEQLRRHLADAARRNRELVSEVERLRRNMNREAAFPFPTCASDGSVGQHATGGMYLRDYFAATILNALMQNQIITRGVYEMKSAAISNGSTPQQFESDVEFPMYANVSYKIADAMLAERAK